MSVPVEIQDADEDGRVTLRSALILTLYFHRGHSREKRQAVLDCFNEFVQLFARRLRWWVVEESSYKPTSRLKKMDMGRYLLAPELDEPEQTWAFNWHAGERSDDASDCRIVAFGEEKTESDLEGDLSFLSIAVPWDWHEADPDGLPRLAVSWAERIAPFHGYGGLGLVVGEDAEAESAVDDRIAAIGARHPGVELDSPLDHLDWLNDGIKGGSWITVLADPFVEQLGGKEVLRAALGDSCRLHEYTGGVVIVAGAEPEWGDRNRGVGTPNYVALAKVLKPIRITDHSGIGRSFGTRLNRDYVLEWLQRLDG